MSVFTDAFRKCLDRIVKKTTTVFDFASLENLFKDCDSTEKFIFLRLFSEGEDHPALHQKVNVSMTLRDLITLALDLDDLERLRAFGERFDAACQTYFEGHDSTVRQEKRLARFAADVGLTIGRRRPKIDPYWVFTDYLFAIDGVECEKLTKREALEMLANKYGIQSPEAVVSHLKRYMKDSKDKYPGILP